MNDILVPEQCRALMSRIRGRNTKPELLLRHGLYNRGLRYRLHRADLPGKPDLVFPKYRAVVFVNGCFWHCHECPFFRWPKTRAAFWRTKIYRNKQRDRDVLAVLKTENWRTLVVRECALRGKYSKTMPEVLSRAESYIRMGQEPLAEITLDMNSQQWEV